MGWLGQLALRYHLQDGRSVCRDEHLGPLRVLKALYPEGPESCQSVIVHPPGGVVGGDELRIDVQVQAGAHALITTPGATRFYRSQGELARQQVKLDLGEEASLEWLPMESIAYSGCEVRNELQMALAPGAQLMGWDVVALGLPAAEQAFERGCFEQSLHWPGHWLERGRLMAQDKRLLDSPLGLAGRRTLATMWWASGSVLTAAQREAFCEAAREALGGLGPWDGAAGVSSPNPKLVTVRALASSVEPLMLRLQAVRAAWRGHAWGLAADPPRLWRT